MQLRSLTLRSYGPCGEPFRARSAGALACHTRRRAGFPRERPRVPVTVVRERLLPNGAWRGELFRARSAGACPPRSVNLRENRPPPKAVSRVDRGMARDRPSPYGETEAALHTVARGPVPRDRSTRAKIVHRPRPFLVSIEAWRGTGPRPTVCGTFFHRSAGACPPRSVDLREHRPPPKAVSRADRGTARDRPSPYGETEAALHTVARGPSHATRACERVSPEIARPARTSSTAQGCFSCRSRHGEGQALALRYAARFFHRDVERFMKHPQR